MTANPVRFQAIKDVERNALAGDHGEDALAEATYAQTALLPAMAVVRAAADSLEAIVADDLWPLPTYQEMLYIL